MKKSELSNGEKMFVIKVNHFVKLRDFAVALTEEYFNKGEPFNKLLSKNEAKKILNHSLFFYGLQGQYHDGFFEASFEEGEKYNSIYTDASNWIKSNYPHLDMDVKIP